MSVLFIDESKEPNYVLAATLIRDADAPRLRKLLQAECRPKQRSIHFKKEDQARRKQLLAVYERHELQTFTFRSSLKNQREAREVCFERLINHALTLGVTRLVIEKDDSIFRADEKIIARLIKEQGALGKIGFEHFYRHEEPILWVPDSIAWCENKGGFWSTLIAKQVIRP